ncbi:VOC family protein [Bradyrhizobium sp. 153]|uniref:VOC family protein n=1 Tax=Bradyrhizobium sp. 153 TaxID=2782627 RepID=UPI001FF9070F|nr:VOC family protein [Bradyrhizobium sp. 153]MCK1667712.1 VOC family protein [Bradyrhizobium sp. 153]
MPRAFQLGFVELGTQHIEPELLYYTEVIGAKVTERAADGSAYLSLGLDHHNIALRVSAETGLRCVGLQVTRDVSIEDWAMRLSEQGLGTSVKTDARPGVTKLVEVVEPGGHVVQLYAEMSLPAPGFATHGIVPNKLGHIAIMSPEAAKSVKFFEQALGFAMTDRIDPGATFLTCNRDHHVLNVVDAPLRKLHHIAFELKSRSHHHDAADFLSSHNIPIVWGPARHTAGHNLASYHFDPDQVLVELYADMDILIPELGWFEPRPWHETLPLKPQVWQRGTLTTWGTKYDFDFRKA